MNDVFHFDNYISYLRSDITAPQRKRGYQAVLARAAGCAAPYLSSVLSEKAHLLPDHGHGLCRYWNFDAEEEDYFMTLLARGRATRPDYAKHLQTRLGDLRKRREMLSHRTKGISLSVQEAGEYYRHWSVAAVHVCSSIPGYQRAESMAELLRIPLDQVHAAIKTLLSLGLIKKTSDIFERTSTNLHLDARSPLIAIHHLNWRNKVIADGFQHGVADADAFHYSSVFALSQKDFAALRKGLFRYFDDLQSTVEKSPEELMAAVCLDLKKLGPDKPNRGKRR